MKSDDNEAHTATLGLLVEWCQLDKPLRQSARPETFLHCNQFSRCVREDAPKGRPPVSRAALEWRGSCFKKHHMRSCQIHCERRKRRTATCNFSLTSQNRTYHDTHQMMDNCDTSITLRLNRNLILLLGKQISGRLWKVRLDPVFMFSGSLFRFVSHFCLRCSSVGRRNCTFSTVPT